MVCAAQRWWWCTRIGNNNGSRQERTGSRTERVGIIRKVAVVIPVREEKGICVEGKRVKR